MNEALRLPAEQSGEDRLDYLRMLEEFGLEDWMLRQFADSAEELLELPEPVNALVRASSIDGQGLFATRAIAAGELIASARVAGRLTTAGRYANHAADANAEYFGMPSGDIHQVALRAIGAGEEITNDYRLNARVEYSRVTATPLGQVTPPMVREAIFAALRNVPRIS